MNGQTNEARLFELTESFLEGTLSDTDRRALARLLADPDVRKEFAAQVRVAHGLRVTLGDGGSARSAERTWAAVERLLDEDPERQRQRVADAVDAAIDLRERRVRRRSSITAMAMVAAAAIVVLATALVLRPREHARVAGDSEAAVAFGRNERPSPGVVASRPPRLLLPQPADPVLHEPKPEDHFEPSVGPVVEPVVAAQPQPASPEGIAGDGPERLAVEEPALTRRQDVRFFGAFDSLAGMARWPIREWRKRAHVSTAPGLSGAGLRVSYPARSGPTNGGTRLHVALVEAAAPPARRPVRLHVRYHVRLDPDFDFAANGGVLPGLCGGTCNPNTRKPTGGDGWAVRLAWLPDGTLALDPILPVMPGRQRLNWTRGLVKGRWHAIELAVRLNTPGKRDGRIEGWLDGQKAITLGGLHFRHTPALAIDTLLFDSTFRSWQSTGPERDVAATFDNVVVAGTYIGPREEAKKTTVTPGPVRD